MATSLQNVNLLNGWTLDPQWRSRLAQWLSNRFGGKIAATDIVKLSALAFRNCASVVIKGSRPVWVALKIIGAMMKRPAHEGASRIVLEAPAVKEAIAEPVPAAPVVPAAPTTAETPEELTTVEKSLVKNGNAKMIAAYVAKKPEREAILQKAIAAPVPVSPVVEVVAEAVAEAVVELVQPVAIAQTKKEKPSKNSGMGFGAKGQKQKEVKDWVAAHTIDESQPNKKPEIKAEYAIDYAAAEPPAQVPALLHEAFRTLAIAYLNLSLHFYQTGEGREEKYAAGNRFRDLIADYRYAGDAMNIELRRQCRAFGF